MEKYKTLNNFAAKEIIRLACVGCNRAVYMLLYNYRDAFIDEVYHRICTVVGEVAPLTLDILKSLPYEVQHYYNRIYADNKELLYR